MNQNWIESRSGVTLDVWRKVFTEEDVFDGDINVESDHETVDIEIDDLLDASSGFLQLAEAVVEWLRDEGIDYAEGATWFYLPDGSRVVNYGAGEREEVSAHIPDTHVGLFSVVCDVIARRRREDTAASARYIARLNATRKA